MLKKSNLSVAIKIALATTMVASLSGCLVEGSTSVSTSSGSVTTVSNPTGTVTGTVQDTNGNPIAGVTVYLAGQSATTDAGGIYTFANIPASNTVGADGQITSTSLSVTIGAPTGYLGATVTVSPQAQIDGTNAGDTTDSGPSVFINGYIASAGTAVLPALTSTVSGTLRDSTTGEAIASTDVRLDLESVNGIAQQQAQNGVSTTYQTFAYTATTDASGNFSIASVPDDAELRFMVEGYGVVSVGANAGGTGDDVSTTDETLVSIGNLMVAAITANDTTPPYVISVDGVVSQTASPTGMFNDNIDGTSIVVNFSETIIDTEVNTNSVVVWDDSNGYQTATTTIAGSSMTVAVPTAIPAGSIVHVFMLKADFLDLSNNALVNATAVGFDTDVASTSGADYVRLEMQIFTDSNLNATAVTLAQEAADATGTDDFSAVQATNIAFADVNDEGGAGNFQQLNSSDDDDTANGSDAGERLSALSAAIGGPAVEANVARVVFTPTNGTTYTIEATDSTGANIGTGSYTASGSSNVVNTTTTATDFTFEVDDTNDVVFLFTSLQPGDVVEITPADDLGHPGTTTSVTLADNVEPTTVLQNSYGATPNENGQVNTVDFGNGGQLISVGDVVIGTPYLNITAQLLDNLDSNGDDKGVVGTGADDDTLRYELMELNTVDLVNCDPGGAACIDPTLGIYDATAYTAMNTTRDMGIAVSEDVSISAGPAYSGAASLTGFDTQNDVTTSDEGNTVNVDLVTMNVDDVITLAADDGTSIDFTGLITDNAGNTAGASNNPVVVVRDAMPPMVQTAAYDGANLIVTFNEGVAPQTGDSVTIGTVTFGLDQTTVDAHTAGSAVLTIPATDPNWIAASGSTGNYGWLQIGTDNLAIWDFTDASGNGYHGVLDFSSIEDVYGNNWDVEHAGITAPNFAYASTVNTTFGVTEGSTDADRTTAGVATVGTVLTFTYTATHAIDMSQFGVLADATGMTAAEVGAAFTFANGATSTIDTGTTNTNASLSANRRVLTVNVVVATADLNPTETFEPQFDFTSDYDGTQPAVLIADVSMAKP